MKNEDSIDSAEYESESISKLKIEYSSAHAAFIHYGRSTLFLLVTSQGIAVFTWYILLTASLNQKTAICLCLFISGLMCVWLIQSHQFRQIYMYKLHRIHELEKALGFEANVRFNGDYPNFFRIYGPSGFVITLGLYSFAALSPATLYFFAIGDGAVLSAPAILSFISGAYVFANERKMQAFLRKQ